MTGGWRTSHERLDAIPVRFLHPHCRNIHHPAVIAAAADQGNKIIIVIHPHGEACRDGTAEAGQGVGAVAGDSDGIAYRHLFLLGFNEFYSSGVCFELIRCCTA